MSAQPSAENDAVAVPPAFAAYAHKVQDFAIETWVTSKAHEWATAEPPPLYSDLTDTGVSRGYRQAQRDLLAVLTEARQTAPARVIPPEVDAS